MIPLTSVSVREVPSALPLHSGSGRPDLAGVGLRAAVDSQRDFTALGPTPRAPQPARGQSWGGGVPGWRARTRKTPPPHPRFPLASCVSA